jgi:putative peptidoglycan lipid II flippase
LNAALLAFVLRRRGHWVADQRLASRAWRMLVATAGMAAALWGALLLLGPVLARADTAGAIALAGVCVLGLAVYAALGGLLGIVRMSELRFVMRRQPGLRSADPGEQP